LPNGGRDHQPRRIAVYAGGWFAWSSDPLNNPIATGDPGAVSPSDVYAA